MMGSMYFNYDTNRLCFHLCILFRHSMNSIECVHYNRHNFNTEVMPFGFDFESFLYVCLMMQQMCRKSVSTCVETLCYYFAINRNVS